MPFISVLVDIFAADVIQSKQLYRHMSLNNLRKQNAVNGRGWRGRSKNCCFNNFKYISREILDGPVGIEIHQWRTTHMDQIELFSRFYFDSAEKFPNNIFSSSPAFVKSNMMHESYPRFSQKTKKNFLIHRRQVNNSFDRQIFEMAIFFQR